MITKQELKPLLIIFIQWEWSLLATKKLHLNNAYIKNEHLVLEKTPWQTWAAAFCVHVKPSSGSQSRKIVPISIYFWRDWVHLMSFSSLSFHIFMSIGATLPSTPLDLLAMSWWERKCAWGCFRPIWMIILTAQHMVTVKGPLLES